MEEPNFYKRALFFIALIWAISIFFPNVPHRIMIPVKIANSYIPGKLLGFASNQIDSYLINFQVLWNSDSIIITDQLRQNVLSSLKLNTEPIAYLDTGITINDGKLRDFEMNQWVIKWKLEEKGQFANTILPDNKLTCRINFFLIIEENKKRELLFCKVEEGSIIIKKRLSTDGYKLFGLDNRIAILSKNNKVITTYSFDWNGFSDSKIKELEFIERREFKKEIIFSQGLEMIYDGENLFSFDNYVPEINIKDDINKCFFTDNIKTHSWFIPFNRNNRLFLYHSGKLTNLFEEYDIDNQPTSTSGSIITTKDSILIINGIPFIDYYQTKNLRYNFKDFITLYQSPHPYEVTERTYFYILGRREINKSDHPIWHFIGIDNKAFNEYDLIPINSFFGEIYYFYFNTENIYDTYFYSSINKSPIAFTNDGVYKFVFIE